MAVSRYSMELAGRTLTLETGRMAKQAGGAVLVTYGETVVLATATTSEEPREGIDFFPLQVEFEEKMYAAGKIPGGFIKREGRPTENAILTARLTDRPLRPLFPKDYRNDVQVVLTVLSADQANDPAICAIIGASAALSISDIPFYGPVGAVRVGLIGGEIVVNPTMPEMAYSDLDLMVAGTADSILMVEAGAKEVPEDNDPRSARGRPRGDQAALRAPVGAPAGGRQAEARVRPAARSTKRSSRPITEFLGEPPRRDDLRSGQGDARGQHPWSAERDRQALRGDLRSEDRRQGVRRAREGDRPRATSWRRAAARTAAR